MQPAIVAALSAYLLREVPTRLQVAGIAQLHWNQLVCWHVDLDDREICVRILTNDLGARGGSECA